MNKKIILACLITVILVVGMSSVSAKLYSNNLDDSYQNSYACGEDYYSDDCSYDDYGSDNDYYYESDYKNTSFNSSTDDSGLNYENQSLASNNKTLENNDTNVSTTGLVDQNATFKVKDIQVLKEGDPGYLQYYCKVITDDNNTIYFSQENFDACNGLNIGDTVQATVEKGVAGINDTAYRVEKIICCN